jgi:AcrR family transcriptional regulator
MDTTAFGVTLKLDQEREQGTVRLDPEREEAILRATLEVLAETGYDGLRLDTVAARAKASKATLYRHWPGKADLVVAAVKCYKQTDLVAATDTGSLRGDLLAALRGIRDMMTGPTGQIMAGLMIAMQRDSELASTVRTTMLEDKQHLVAQMLGRAVERGELPAETDPEIFPEIAPAVLFNRIFLHGKPADEPYLTFLTDKILIPLMTRH